MGRDWELFEQIWPSGIPPREQIVFDAVAPKKREMVLNRIEAVWRAERGEPWEPLAASIGLSRAGFYKVRKAWREHGIAGVVPHGTQQPRRVSIEDNHPLRKAAEELLRAEGGGARNADIARSLFDAQGEANRDLDEHRKASALQRIERLVQHERKALGRNPKYISTAYGQGLLVDLTAVAIQLDDDERKLAIVAVVVETASGLIIASRLGSQGEFVDLQREAIAEGLEFLAEHKADRTVDAQPKVDLHFTLPPPFSEQDLVLHELRKSVRDLSIGRPGGHTYGQALVQWIGPRVGRIALAPRSTLDIKGLDYSRTRNAQTLSRSMAEAAWRREVLRHNEPILHVLKSVGAVGGRGVGDGRMAQVLRGIDVVLAGALRPSFC